MACLIVLICDMQAIRPELLQRGFDLVQEEQLEVTDDVSIIEALGEPVQITQGSYTNIKVKHGLQTIEMTSSLN